MKITLHYHKHCSMPCMQATFSSVVHKPITLLTVRISSCNIILSNFNKNGKVVFIEGFEI